MKNKILWYFNNVWQFMQISVPWFRTFPVLKHSWRSILHVGARTLPGFSGHPVNLACIQILSWHDNQWWPTSHSLESRSLKSLTSRLFVDRDEEEPRAIRERWSVFINSVLENFPTGVEDRPTSGREEGESGPSRRRKMKERNGRTENHRCARNRSRMRMQIFTREPSRRVKEPAICAAIRPGERWSRTE